MPKLRNAAERRGRGNGVWGNAEDLPRAEALDERGDKAGMIELLEECLKSAEGMDGAVIVTRRKPWVNDKEFDGASPLPPYDPP